MCSMLTVVHVQYCPWVLMSGSNVFMILLVVRTLTERNISCEFWSPAFYYNGEMLSRSNVGRWCAEAILSGSNIAREQWFPQAIFFYEQSMSMSNGVHDQCCPRAIFSLTKFVREHCLPTQISLSESLFVCKQCFPEAIISVRYVIH
jgi:hypothetical protein